MAMKALPHGQQVFCEKPMAKQVQQTQEMLSSTQKQVSVNIVNFTWGRLPLCVYIETGGWRKYWCHNVY